MAASGQGCCLPTSWPNCTTYEIPHKEAMGGDLWKAWKTILLWPTSKAKDCGEVFDWPFKIYEGNMEIPMGGETGECKTRQLS